MTPAPGPFHLSKWYLDCVSGEGEVFLAYCAELRWRALRLHYASVLGHSSSLREVPAPVWRGDGVLEWNAPALGVTGRWEVLDPPIQETLMDGACQWRCLVPRARAEVRVGDRSLLGLGYAEHLTMSVPPWRLGIQELRWGRFLSETDGLVWIEWRGPKPARLRWHNGVRAGEELKLEIRDREVLREGPLIETALSFIPNIRKLFPARILDLREAKWRSRAALGATEGWAIHEVVEWP
jgi:hypothetical protein